MFAVSWLVLLPQRYLVYLGFGLLPFAGKGSTLAGCLS
jgi:hypothetical protein